MEKDDKKKEADVLKESAILLLPIRFKIIETLRTSSRPMYIEEIADEIGEDRRLVAFHLSTLEEKGFTQSEFRKMDYQHSAGRACRYYALTPKVKEVLAQLSKIINL